MTIENRQSERISAILFEERGHWAERLSAAFQEGELLGPWPSPVTNMLERLQHLELAIEAGYIDLSFVRNHWIRAELALLESEPFLHLMYDFGYYDVLALMHWVLAPEIGHFEVDHHLGPMRLATFLDLWLSQEEADYPAHSVFEDKSTIPMVLELVSEGRVHSLEREHLELTVKYAYALVDGIVKYGQFLLPLGPHQRLAFGQPIKLLVFNVAGYRMTSPGVWERDSEHWSNALPLWPWFDDHENDGAPSPRTEFRQALQVIGEVAALLAGNRSRDFPATLLSA